MLKPGKNIVALQVKNKMGSSDLYMDLELLALVPIPRPPRKKESGTSVATGPKTTTPAVPVVEEPRDPNALKIDKATKTITIAGVVALRKLPNLDEKYPIEVIGTYPAPRGQKAHETALSFKGVRPSDVHKALESLGLKPASQPMARTPVRRPSREGKRRGAQGWKTERVPIEKCLVHRDTGKPIGMLTWHFTGSVMKQPDPKKDDTVYGADMTGTFSRSSCNRLRATKPTDDVVLPNSSSRLTRRCCRRKAWR